MIGKELIRLGLANRRAKIEPEEDNLVTCRRVGLVAGTEGPRIWRITANEPVLAGHADPVCDRGGYLDR